jgi:hypothetical protein
MTLLIAFERLNIFDSYGYRVGRKYPRLKLTLRHSREGGNPGGDRYNRLTMDSRLRGNDGDGFAELALLHTLILTNKKVGLTKLFNLFERRKQNHVHKFTSEFLA